MSADSLRFVGDPDRAWAVEKLRQKVESMPLLSGTSPKPPGHTRFVCISDTHGLTHKLPKALPEGDVLLHAGDFSNTGLPKEVDKFLAFLSEQPHSKKIVIAGNHDLTFDVENYPRLWRRFGHTQQFDCETLKKKVYEASGVFYLEDSGTQINGIHIWGSPWQPEFCGWAFNLTRGDACQSKWDLIPDGVDILMTHGPPLGHGDTLQNGGRSGCVNLLHTIQQRIRPKYHVFGHIHEGYGQTTDGRTVYVNASTCNFLYRPINPPIVFDFPNSAITA